LDGARAAQELELSCPLAGRGSFLAGRPHRLLRDCASLSMTTAPTHVEFNSLSEPEIVAFAAALGASNISGLSRPEESLIAAAPSVSPRDVERARFAIVGGSDPLGTSFSVVRSPTDRRPLGATYTPLSIVDAMIEWAATQGAPARVVDPGVGSARFLSAAGSRFPNAQLFGVEVDPLAALIARANLAVMGFAARAEVQLSDYRSLALPQVDGRTLYIGNPPYVRHHLVSAEWKEWLTARARSLGYSASTLAGLHVYFFLATVLHAQVGDFGAFITAAEWLDVNYGKLVRQLFLNEMGGQSISLIEPSVRPFPDAATTGAITTFAVGKANETIRLRRVRELTELKPIGSGNKVRRERLASEERWTVLSRVAREIPEGYVELGELCRVHRGQVTGNNKVWIAGPHGAELPDRVRIPTVTKARELIQANGRLDNASVLRRVIDLPVDLDEFDNAERGAVDRFLTWARSVNAHRGYIAEHRRAWWAVGLREPPPIMATYMARRPPTFVRNLADARYINIAHGIYPREPLTAQAVARLTSYLSKNAMSARGRTYAGGLLKFEPREMERIVVPGPALLAESAVQ
jgi:hypothetical protein